MMERGAKHFAFVSRSAADKPEAADLISSLTNAGAFPQVFRGDAGNVADIDRVVAELTINVALQVLSMLLWFSM